MNQFLSNKIIAGIVAVALLVGVGVLVSSGDTSSTTRNAALVVATPCTKPGQVTKLSKQSVVCAALSPKNIWYPIFKEKKWICAKLGITRKQNGIFSVCGKNKLSKKRWFLTKPLMANSNPGLPTTDQDAFIKLTSNPELIVETSPTTPLAPASVTEITIAPTTETTLSATTETTLAATTTPTTPPAATTSAIPLTCAAGGTCEVGDIGPGGGIVFYVVTTPFTCGEDLKAKCTYLEAAIADVKAPVVLVPPNKDDPVNPNDGSGRPQWCFNLAPIFGTGAKTEIGSGLANTKKITDSNCKGIDNSVSAPSVAATYNGGGKTDWFLPSRDELNELCKYARTQTTGNSLVICDSNGILRNGFAAGRYWSSSEVVTNNVWSQNFFNGDQRFSNKLNTYSVRPVRAFSAICALGGTCAIGDIGPGGGIVFYVVTTPFTCGEDLKAKCTYLEAAIANGTTTSTWTPDTKAQWGCNIEDAMTSDQRAASLEIGAGRANTKIITGKNCMGEEYSGRFRPSSEGDITNSVSAASIAASYNGGGKADWFLPSRDELNEICKIYSNGRTDTTEFSDYQNGCTGNTSPTGGYNDQAYWSSSEDYTWQCENQCAWTLAFGIGGWGANSKHGSHYVRPVRAF